MPEGDTIFRAAVRLREVLTQAVIERATSRDERSLPAAPLVGQTVTTVEARGKHLIMHLSAGGGIHSHMGMTGSWHVYQLGETWQKPVRQAALTLETATAVIVCFSPKQLEILSAAGLRRHPWLQRLGPDILAQPFAYDEALRRFQMAGLLPLGVAVLHQGLVCGIGNVYKSEVLFLERLNPFAEVQQFSPEQLRQVLEKTKELMQQNLKGHPRQTRFGGDGPGKWTYGRSGEPCLVCGTLIAMRRQGDLGRSTYYCPACQGVEPAGSSAKTG